jgi:hypothetical protein
MQKNKIATIAICIILSVSMLGALANFSSAHTPSWTIPTFPHIYVATDPIGVGQKASIYMFVTPTYADTQILNDYRFRNYKLIITAPSGAVTEQNFPYIVDTTSNQGTSFVPNEVGTYNLTFIFPEQKVNDYPHLPNSAFENDTYMGGTASTTLTVTQEPVLEISYPPLPTEYWTRPIFGENTMWNVISSNWLGGGLPGYGGSTGPNQRVFSGDSIGSLTSHIMWTKTLDQPGGVAGGNNFEIPGSTWFEGTAYSQRYVNPIIVAGRLYYQEPLFSTGTGTRAGSGPAGPTVCVDLFTGKEVWRRADVPALSFAYVQDMQNPDYHGVRPAMLATTNFAQVYDAATGTNVFNVSNVPSGTNVVGPNGEVIKYMFVNNGTNASPAYYLCQWNSSRFWGQGSMQQLNLQTVTQSTTVNVSQTTYVNGVSTTTLTPVTSTSTFVNASRAIMYDIINSVTPADQNVSIPWRNNMPGNPSIVGAIYGDILLCMNGSRPSSVAPTGNNPYNYFAVNLNASVGPIGQVLWSNTVQPPIDPNYGNLTSISFAGMDKAGYFCESYRQTSQFAFFNLRTGAFIKLSDPQPALDYYGSTGSGSLHNVVAFGRCYSGAYSGILYCYDMATGNVLWTYGNGGVPGNNTDSGLEVPGHYPIFVKAIGGRNLNDGVIYTIVTEHTFATPIYKGALTRAINASDGSEIYTFNDVTGEFGAGSFAIADSYTNFFNSYDSRIYTLGKGPSETTVTVGPKSSTIGGNVVIEGTVTDVSVGLQTTEIKGRFPAGVPVCADSSMKDWMAYIHQQQPKPDTFTGVNVNIILIDSNGNYQGPFATTTDGKGYYSLTYTPNISGDFKVYAYFDGTNGYWPSNTETTFNMVESPATPTPAPTTVPSMADQYFLPMSAAIIVAIVVIGALLALLMLRKRP